MNESVVIEAKSIASNASATTISNDSNLIACKQFQFDIEGAGPTTITGVNAAGRTITIGSSLAAGSYLYAAIGVKELKAANAGNNPVLVSGFARD